MLSSDFQTLFNEHMQKLFKGVFSFDTIPKSLKSGHFYICNTASSESPGEHWFAVYRPNQELLEVFDSLGVTEEKIGHLKPKLKYRGI